MSRVRLVNSCKSSSRPCLRTNPGDEEKPPLNVALVNLFQSPSRSCLRNTLVILRASSPKNITLIYPCQSPLRPCLRNSPDDGESSIPENITSFQHAWEYRKCQDKDIEIQKTCQIPCHISQKHWAGKAYKEMETSAAPIYNESRPEVVDEFAYSTLHRSTSWNWVFTEWMVIMPFSTRSWTKRHLRCAWKVMGLLASIAIYEVVELSLSGLLFQLASG